MKVCGELTEHEEVVFHSIVVDERDELARRFIIRASVREVLGRHVASEARSFWFDGRAYVCTAERLRAVVSDDRDRLGMDECRQVDQLLNYEDSTFRTRLSLLVEVSTEPTKGTRRVVSR